MVAVQNCHEKILRGCSDCASTNTHNVVVSCCRCLRDSTNFVHHLDASTEIWTSTDAHVLSWSTLTSDSLCVVDAVFTVVFLNENVSAFFENPISGTLYHAYNIS